MQLCYTGEFVLTVIWSIASHTVLYTTTYLMHPVIEEKKRRNRFVLDPLLWRNQFLSDPNWCVWVVCGWVVWGCVVCVCGCMCMWKDYCVVWAVFAMFCVLYIHVCVCAYICGLGLVMSNGMGICVSSVHLSWISLVCVCYNCSPLQPRASELTRLPRKVKPVLSDKEKEKLQKVAAARKRQNMVSRVTPPAHLPQGAHTTFHFDFILLQLHRACTVEIDLTNQPSIYKHINYICL